MLIRSAIAAALLTLVVVSIPSVAQDVVPRYKLTPRQEIQYQGSSDVKYDQGGSVHLDFTWTLWVIGRNGDGSWRVVEQHTSAYQQSGTLWPAVGSETMDIGRFNISPDGRIKVTDSSMALLNPMAVLPRLPDAATDGHWQQALSGGTTFDYSAMSSKTTNDFVFRYDVHSPDYDLDLLKDSGTLYFDVQRGLVRSGTTEWFRGRGHTCKGPGTLTLKSVQTRDEAFIKQLDSECDVYFKATAAYGHALDDAREDAARTASIMKRAAEELRDARAQIALPLLAGLLDKTLAGNDATVKGIEMANEEEARHVATMINKPAADWELKDLHGKTRRLSDYRGKVLLLDFWYSRCGFCIDAMPQIKQVVDDFKNDPVVVLGMNTDEDLKDAQSIVDRMGLSYNNLRAIGVSEKYGVDGFPTVILIDALGTIRAVHVGYSADLREELGRDVRKFLPGKTATQPS